MVVYTTVILYTDKKMVMVNLMVTDVLTKVIGKMDGKVEKE